VSKALRCAIGEAPRISWSAKPRSQLGHARL
jgi:hypothetical protein